MISPKACIDGDHICAGNAEAAAPIAQGTAIGDGDGEMFDLITCRPPGVTPLVPERTS